MALTKYCFGDLIELSFIRNSEGLYNEDDTIGVNIDKEIRVMKGDSSRKELKTFWIVKPGFFVYNPSLVNAITYPPECFLQHLLRLLFRFQNVTHFSLNTSHLRFIVDV